MKNKIMGIIFMSVIGLSISSCIGKKTESEINVISMPSFDLYTSPNAPSEPLPFRDISAFDLVAEMKIGWNLGNTLDATDGQYYGGNWLRRNNPDVLRMETSWGNPVTTKENFTTLKNAGFDIIRIPVSWAKAADSNLIIRHDWLDRVTEIVNYAVENDMFIILNTHHDEEIFRFTAAEKEKSLEAFETIWWQIAYNFRNYNEKLIFEGLNEPRTKGSRDEWSGGTAAEHAVLNEHYQLFVNIVRASGGNNDKRMLMINTYAASAEQRAIDALSIPADPAENKLIVSIHAYAPWEFALKQDPPFRTVWSASNQQDTSAIHAPFDRAYNKFVSNGIPVIMGEFGAVDRDNIEARSEWAEYYVRYAKNRGIPCVLWDNGGFHGDGELFGFLDRRSNTFPYQPMLEAFMRGVED